MPISITEINKYAEFAWSTLGFEISPEPSAGDKIPNPVVTANVQISGQWQGAITLMIEKDLALKLAEKMFSGQQKRSSDEEVIDAISEMINIMGGNLKSLLPQPSQLSIPIVNLKGTKLQFPLMEQASKAAFDCMGKKFMVSVHQAIEQPVLDQP